MPISDTTRPALGRDEAYPVTTSPAEEARTASLSQIAWGAVFAGAVIGLVLQVISLYDALALILGALAAFFVGRMGAVDPRLTHPTTRLAPRRA